jgi:hypothetical protein
MRPLLFGSMILRGFGNLVLEKKDIQTMAPELKFKKFNELSMISDQKTLTQIQHLYFILCVFGVVVVEKSVYLPAGGVSSELVCVCLCLLLEPLINLITFTLLTITTLPCHLIFSHFIHIFM